MDELVVFHNVKRRADTGTPYSHSLNLSEPRRSDCRYAYGHRNALLSFGKLNIGVAPDDFMLFTGVGTR